MQDCYWKQVIAPHDLMSRNGERDAWTLTAPKLYENRGILQQSGFPSI